MFKSFHDINLDESKIEYINSSKSPILDLYISDTVKFTINESKHCQRYKLIRETVEVYTLIKNFFDSNFKLELFQNTSNQIANILFNIETESNKGAIKPKSGALVQCLSKQNENNYYYTLVKNEFFDAISRKELTLLEAFLYDTNKKTPSKICIFDLSYNNSLLKINNIYVDDSINPNHGPLWYKDFLGLDKVHTDSYNTKTTIEKLNSFWQSEFKEDRRTLFNIKNDTLYYFRNNNEFELEKFKETIIDFYKDEVEINKLDTFFEKINSDIDSKFNIDKSEIKKRLTSLKFKIDSDINLIIEGGHSRANNRIYILPKNEKKFIMIETVDEKTINSFTNIKSIDEI